jgi:hypothetical protein
MDFQIRQIARRRPTRLVRAWGRTPEVRVSSLTPPIPFVEAVLFTTYATLRSATGATNVHNLAYAQRLGLWCGEDFRSPAARTLSRPSKTAASRRWRFWRATFVRWASIPRVAIARQRRIRHASAPDGAWANPLVQRLCRAFACIHNTLDIAMKAANLIGDSGTMDWQAAKSVAKLCRRVQTA